MLYDLWQSDILSDLSDFYNAMEGILQGREIYIDPTFEKDGLGPSEYFDEKCNNEACTIEEFANCLDEIVVRWK